MVKEILCDNYNTNQVSYYIKRGTVGWETIKTGVAEIK